MTPEQIISTLNLQPHSEGGWYCETYRSAETTKSQEGNIRNVSTAIYFLLEGTDVSKFHRIKSDELWFFHHGEAIEIVVIEDGKINTIKLGNDFQDGERLQAVIPAGKWFGAKVSSGKGYALVSCVVAPGFDFSDFELAERDSLVALYPQLKDTVVQFT